MAWGRKGLISHDCHTTVNYDIFNDGSPYCITSTPISLARLLSEGMELSCISNVIDRRSGSLRLLDRVRMHRLILQQLFMTTQYFLTSKPDATNVCRRDIFEDGTTG